MKQIKPPGLANILLRMILRREDYLEKTGDLEEVYSSLIEEKGKAIAIVWYWIQTFTAIPAILSNSFYWSMAMLKNNLKIGFKKLLQQKMYSFITISGISVGLGIFLLFFRFYNWQSTPDSFHKDIDRVYNVVQVFNSGSGERHTAYIPYQFAPSLKNDIPEIEDYSRFFEAPRTIVKYKENIFYENGICSVDPNFLSVFSFSLIEGNSLTLLSKPNSVVITKAISEKYFGDESPIGKMLTLNNKTDVEVTGVVKNLLDLPSESSISFSFLVPLETANSLYGSIDNWKENNITGFIRLKEKSDLKQIENKLEQLRNKYFQSAVDSPRHVYLYPTRGFVNNAPYIERFANYHPTAGGVLLMILGSFFLLVGIFNYINLSTARYTERLKELGVRKVVGASKVQLIKQFMAESVLISILSLPFTIIVYNIVLAYFNSINSYMPDLSFWKNNLIITSIIISLLTGILAGIYPAFFLSSFHPIQIITGKLNKGKSHGRLRKTLVILQFTLSFIFLAGASIFQKQAEFQLNTDLGYDRKGVLAIPLSDEAKKNYPLLKTRIENFADVINTTASKGVPGGWSTKKNVIPEGMEADKLINSNYCGIGYDFFKTMNMRVILGRPFSIEYNEENNVIINQKFARNLGWDLPIGKSLKVGDKICTIVGVVNDIQFDNLFFRTGPVVFFIEEGGFNYMLIKTNGIDKISSVRTQIKMFWNEYSPGLPFDSFTLDEFFERSNQDAYVIFVVLRMLGILAVFYSGLGLLALVSFAVRQRKKEIAIRKTLGASMPVILRLLSRDFLKLVIIANIIALPLAYLAFKNLLEFATSVPVPFGVGIFIFTIIFTLIIAVFAVTGQVYKAAIANPVDSLKSE